MCTVWTKNSQMPLMMAGCFPQQDEIADISGIIQHVSSFSHQGRHQAVKHSARFNRMHYYIAAHYRQRQHAAGIPAVLNLLDVTAVLLEPTILLRGNSSMHLRVEIANSSQIYQELDGSTVHCHHSRSTKRFSICLSRICLKDQLTG